MFYDRDVVVVDKPVGMLSVAYEPGNKDTLVDYTQTLLRRMGGRGVDVKLGVVHRLDKDTSGLMVFARTAHAKRALATEVRCSLRGRSGSCIPEPPNVFCSSANHPMTSRRRLNRFDRLAANAYAPIRMPI